eukprot:TRINITY_DN29973_c0_g1_i1.p1 TRINITY_DN29973_c0_g1~~TRINITY_DN29973_c0_g1_i1.p1  ORF type:complete len:662 (-),score=144.50 TRINITY_DN29973_c0_g1_i1:96-2081(-)
MGCGGGKYAVPSEERNALPPPRCFYEPYSLERTAGSRPAKVVVCSTSEVSLDGLNIMQALQKEMAEKSFVTLAYSWAGGGAQFGDDFAVLDPLKKKFLEACASEGKESAAAQRTFLAFRNRLLQLQWWSSFVGQIMVALRTEAAKGSSVVAAVIPGGPITTVEQAEMQNIVDATLRDLDSDKLGSGEQGNLGDITIMTFVDYPAFEKFLVRERLVHDSEAFALELFNEHDAEIKSAVAKLDKLAQSQDVPNATTEVIAAISRIAHSGPKDLPPSVLHHFAQAGRGDFLCEVIRNTQGEALRKLLKVSAQPETTALHLAVLAGLVDAARALLDASRAIEGDAMRDLLLSKSKSVGRKTVGKKGGTCLHLALEGKRPEFIEVFLAAAQSTSDEDVSKFLQLTNGDGFTALHMAADKGDIDVVDAILNVARGVGNDALLKLLVLQSSSILGQPTRGVFPLHCAAEGGHLEIFDKLLCTMDELDKDACKTQLSALSKENQTPLHLACKEGHHLIVGSLLALAKKLGADVLANVLLAGQDSGEGTALHAAAGRNWPHIAKLLFNAAREGGDDLLRKVLVANGFASQNVLHTVSMGGDAEGFVKLVLLTAKELGPDVMLRLLEQKDLRQQTPAQTCRDFHLRDSEMVKTFADFEAEARAALQADEAS